MKPFNHEEALKGKLCKTAGGDLAIVYGDTANSPYLKNKDYRVLVGVVINRTGHVITTSWNLDGSFGMDPSNNDILGILEDHEVRAIENLQLLENAMRDNKYVQWYESGINGPIAVEKKLENGNFILGFGKWKYETNGGGLINLHIVK